MHHLPRSTAGFAARALACLALLLGAPALAADDTPPRPNIVFIMVDDLGLYDLNCYGFEAVDTPHTNRLAAQGVRFTRAYAAAPVCSPARAGVITGQAPARIGLTNHISRRDFSPDNAPLLDADTLKGLPPSALTYAELLRDAGYACGFFGKWHLSLRRPHSNGEVTNPETLPDRQGFLNNAGGSGNGGPGRWFSPFNNPYLEDGQDGDYLPHHLADQAAAFIRAHRDRPFLLNFWNFTVHAPLETTPELSAKYQAKRRAGARLSSPVYTGMIEATDQVLGKILHTLDELGLSENTLVLLTSDNGGINKLTHTPTGETELRLGKGYLYEGGLRIPMIARWPGTIAAGSTNDTRVSHLDLLPTFLEAAGVTPPADLTLDGESLVPLLTTAAAPQRDALYFHYPNYAWHGKNRLGGAVIQNEHKLILRYDDDSAELYNIEKDPGETHDLAAQQPQLADQMKQKLKAWLAATQANMPRPNDAYVPAPR